MRVALAPGKGDIKQRLASNNGRAPMRPQLRVGLALDMALSKRCPGLLVGPRPGAGLETAGGVCRPGAVPKQWSPLTRIGLRKRASLPLISPINLFRALDKEAVLDKTCLEG